MPALNDKPVRALMRDMTAAFDLAPGQTFSRERAVQWFREHYPNVKEGTVTAHLIRLSTNVATRLQYSARDDGSDDLLYKVDSRHFRLYDRATDPVPVTAHAPAPEEPDPEADEPRLSEEFAFEHDLRDYLAGNLHALEPGLRLYQEDGIRGIEFPVGQRFIDILAIDRNGDYVVIELKVSKGYDKVIGQLLRYIGWIEEHHAEPGKQVRGMIVAKTISEDLRLACRRQAGVSLHEYKLSVEVQRVAG